MIGVCLQNLGKYNEGELWFKWLTLPATEEEIEETLKEIGVSDEPDENGIYYDEYHIADYDDTEGLNLNLGEYESLSRLNSLAEDYDRLKPYEQEQVKIYLQANQCCYSDDLDALEEAINHHQDVIFREADSLADLAQMEWEECGYPKYHLI